MIKRVEAYLQKSANMGTEHKKKHYSNLEHRRQRTRKK